MDCIGTTAEQMFQSLRDALMNPFQAAAFGVEDDDPGAASEGSLQPPPGDVPGAASCSSLQPPPDAIRAEPDTQPQAAEGPKQPAYPPPGYEMVQVTLYCYPLIIGHGS